MKLQLVALLFTFALTAQAQVVVVGGGAITEREHQAFQVNAAGVLDLKGRNVCRPRHQNFDLIVYCKPNDVVLFGAGDGIPALSKIFSFCKMDEPIYYVENAVACVFEDKSDQVRFYRPRPPKTPEVQSEPKPEKERKRKPEKRPWEHVD